MTIKRLSIFFIALFSLAFIVSCSEDDSASVSYVTFEKTSFPIGIPVDETSTTDIKVFAGNVSGSDRTYNVIVNTTASTAEPQYYSVPSTVTIPANSNEGVIAVQVTGTNIGAGKTIVLDIEKGEGYTAGPAMTINISEVCLNNEVRLNLILDRYGSETDWELYSDTDLVNPIASGGPYTDISTNTAQPVRQFDFCLEDGDYTFVIYDVYADGICCTYGAGSYTFLLITDSGSEVLATGGSFGAFEIANFTL